MDFNMTTKQTVKYLVGHYINFAAPREREFHVDYTHDNLESAMKDWQYLCTELPKETDVEIRKQTTEFAVGRTHDAGLDDWSMFDQS